MKGSNTAKQVNGVHELDRYSIVVHSHLKWDWVWQRPQQFLSRLSLKHSVLFVESPDACDDAPTTRPYVRDVTDFPNINVLQIKIPGIRASDTPWVDQERR